MANLKALKIRIKSVKSTQKITKAMKTVASARLKKAKNAVENCRPYQQKIGKIASSIVSDINDLDIEMSQFSLLVGNEKQEKHLVIVISADRGLCGGLNSSTVKLARNHIAKLLNSGKEVQIICLGKKSYELLKTQYSQQIVQKYQSIFQKAVDYADACKIANEITLMFNNQQFDVAEVIYSKFKSAISQEQVVETIIPLNEQMASNPQDRHIDNNNLYQPSQVEILKSLLSEALAVTIYSKMLENFASEQGARMSAMESASSNAGKMVKNLTLVYNRTRQANITRDLIDIVSGANSV